MLRVKAQPAGVLEGREPRRLRRRAAGAGALAARASRSTTRLPADPAVRDRLTQRIEVSVRNLRTRTFITAGIAVDAPDMPNRAAIPNGPPGIWSRAARCGAATPTASPSTRPSRPSASCAAAGSDYDRALRQLPRDPARRRARRGRRDPDRGRLPGVGRGRVAPVLAKRPEFGTRRASSRRRRRGARGARACGARGRSRSGCSAARTTRSTTSSRSRPTSAAASPTPRRRRPRRARSRASCSRRSRATASSTPARWRCCCGWAACPRASRPASPPAPTTARPRSTSCATSTPTRGSRCGSPASAG